ncbi:thioredoxin domain-containing protein [Lacibacter sediminis]|uniref:Thioredoxin domain-containing protein n=1 Tax=Lacibacter sediminis TaxID=2760713 RepID=A0A7G5XEP8_9BACT|nr:thioredoxin domain-containing protein [Lacibacter sediminis]QNA43951.1 thioredoxin domain-containing protein [Lacibacter sediminis]
MAHTNRLTKESSPYLLQHAHNPVDWFPWGEEALKKAVEEDKPVLVSIGYSSCHWCHVMERESFEDETTADIMNRLFINIKIDREERPDLDHIYMDAVQAMTGSGGWPLNVFLTPDLKPFYGGTYYPPIKAFNRSSWKEVLYGVANAFKEKREEIEQQATELVQHLQNANSFGTQKVLKFDLPAEELFPNKQAELMFDAVMKTADRSWGGFGNAPKFPQTFTIGYLLQYYHFTGNKEALAQACLSLEKMIEGGIYDHVGGGFARYSTDAEWLAPHFEKMLYDNALLVIVLSEAWQLTKQPQYKRAIEETLVFIEREMTSSENGFYSALDADSEGVEGKYYTWKKQEVEDVLKEDAALFSKFYDITEHGNWEDVNIPRIKQKAESFCAENGLELSAFEKKMKSCLALLLKTREKRIKPLLDDKILLSWNALMNDAYSSAFAATGKEVYRQKAISNMQFLLKVFEHRDGLWHVYKDGTAKHPAFLDDYAYLIKALLHLQEITSDTNYLLKAKELMAAAIDQFGEEETGYFFFTAANQPDIVVRKKEIYDGATPSGNAVMAVNLQKLGIFFHKPEWTERSTKMLLGLQDVMVRYPGSFGVWAGLLQNRINGFRELAIVGNAHESKRDEVLGWYRPNIIMQSSTKSNSSFPLLLNRDSPPGITFFYLCKEYACLQPTAETQEIRAVLTSVTG